MSDIFAYMKETSRVSDGHTLSLLGRIAEEDANVAEYASHLARQRNVPREDGNHGPKTRNALGRLIFESCTDADWQAILPALSSIEIATQATYVFDDIIDA